MDQEDGAVSQRIFARLQVHTNADGGTVIAPLVTVESARRRALHLNSDASSWRIVHHSDNQTIYR